MCHRSQNGAITGLAQPAFPERHAAATRHTVIRVEKTVGVVKAYLQLKAATATKQMASVQAMLRTRFKVSPWLLVKGVNVAKWKERVVT
jgi:hypothetical protein